ncbi:carbohydrate kinase family protein [Aquirufa regiilacus]|uniref:Carbohydrate kinase n=1 Tax=Aquirufa regiilacus TaxID=3024868 RepID=A0ABU3TP88_9BACT|nr:carbohydrate kinase [Aquirufa sp. LEOWEIH-7C]MDU0807680.1 carbohydrate kinase [Aquirufa sp. LEOWEIH-7C]
MSVLCIGEALIDMICTDKGSSLSDGQNFLKKPGGAPTNVAAAIGALGGSVALSAKVGNDPFGKQLNQVMSEFNVNTQHVHLDSNHFTTFAFVSLMLDGERDFVFNRGADAELTVAEVSQIDLTQTTIIHFGSATAFLDGPLNAAYYHLLEAAKNAGKTISFDPNYRHLLFGDKQESFIKQSWIYLKQAHFTKLSDEEAMLITGKSSLEDAAADLLANIPGVFTITLGKDGTLLGLEGKTYIIPSIQIKPTDTTGAGDAFVGAVLYQLDNASLNPSNLGFDGWNKIIQNANKAGARTCEYMGAMEAFKHLNNSIFN